MSSQIGNEIQSSAGHEQSSANLDPGHQTHISLWARIRILFSRAFRALCGCSSTLRPNTIRRSSFFVEDLTSDTNNFNDLVNTKTILGQRHLCENCNRKTLENEMHDPTEYFHIAENCPQPNILSTSLVTLLHDSLLNINGNAEYPRNAATSELIVDTSTIVDFEPLILSQPLISQHKSTVFTNHDREKKIEKFHNISTHMRNEYIPDVRPKVTTNVCDIASNVKSYPASNIVPIFNKTCDRPNSHSIELAYVENSNELCRNLSNERRLNPFSITSDHTPDVRNFVELLVVNAYHVLSNLTLDNQNSEFQQNSDLSSNLKTSLEDDSDGEECGNFKMSPLHFKLSAAKSKPEYRRSPPPLLHSRQLSDTDDEPGINEDIENCFCRSSTEHNKSSPTSDRFFEDSKRHKSMKSEHSPFYVPVRKLVRFADCMGLDLQTELEVFDHEKPPKIPSSAFQDINLETTGASSFMIRKRYQLSFSQPGASSDFIRRLLENMVVLENVEISETHEHLIGTIRVKRIGNKSTVFLRITYNNWDTYTDILATKIADSYDGATERFTFTTKFLSTVVNVSFIYFAICYKTDSDEIFWDNNYGRNYSIRIFIENNEKTHS